MNWAEPKPPTKHESYYNHTTCYTPLGKAIIEWKSWKQDPDYGIIVNDIYITTEYSLEDAKETTKKYLFDKYEELKLFLYY